MRGVTTEPVHPARSGLYAVKGTYLNLKMRLHAYERFNMQAVTLEGTIIHKSGLITGGRSTHNNSKKWDEKDVQGSGVRVYSTTQNTYF